MRIYYNLVTIVVLTNNERGHNVRVEKHWASERTTKMF